MEMIKKIEELVAKAYEPVPRLPAQVRGWLAQNIWWLTLIGVILGALSLLNALFATILTGAVLTAVGGGLGVLIGGAIFLGVLATVLVEAICVVLGGLAVAPLRATKRKGWVLLFWGLLIASAMVVLTNVFSLNIFGLIFGGLWMVVVGYFLFEVRSYFESETHRKKVKAHQK